MKKTIKKTVSLPETLDEFTLKQWMDFNAAITEKSGKITTDKKRIEYAAVNIFIGLSKKEFDGMSVKDRDHILAEITKVTNQKHEFKTRFELDGIEYGFIPNLNDIKFKEFVDLESTYGIDKLHEMMSVLYRPITIKVGDRYEIKKYVPSDGSHLIGMPAGIAMGAMSFFLILGQQLSVATLKSIPKEDLKRSWKAVLQKNGGGSLQYTAFAGEIS